MTTIKEKLKDIYILQSGDYDYVATVSEWASSYVFNLTTYDGGLDELFVKKIIEVLRVIIDRKNFEYIKDEKNYITYILVCQVLDKMNWLEWGGSIRGAWLNDFENQSPICSFKCTFANGEEILEEVPYSEENVIAFVEWMEEELSKETQE